MGCHKYLDRGIPQFLFQKSWKMCCHYNVNRTFTFVKFSLQLTQNRSVYFIIVIMYTNLVVKKFYFCHKCNSSFCLVLFLIIWLKKSSKTFNIFLKLIGWKKFLNSKEKNCLNFTCHAFFEKKPTVSSIIGILNVLKRVCSINDIGNSKKSTFH